MFLFSPFAKNPLLLLLSLCILGIASVFLFDFYTKDIQEYIISDDETQHYRNIKQPLSLIERLSEVSSSNIDFHGFYLLFTLPYTQDLSVYEIKTSLVFLLFMNAALLLLFLKHHTTWPVALTAALLFCITPNLIIQSQVMRPYIFLIFLLLCTLLLVEKRRCLPPYLFHILLFFLCGWALLTHVTSIIPLTAICLTLFIKETPNLWQKLYFLPVLTLLINKGVLLLYRFFVYPEHQHVQKISYIISTQNNTPSFLSDFLLGKHSSLTHIDKSLTIWISIGILALILLGIFGLFRQRHVLFYILSLTFAFCIILAATNIFPLNAGRHLSYLYPFLFIALAFGLSTLEKRLFRGLSVILLAGALYINAPFILNINLLRPNYIYEFPYGTVTDWNRLLDHVDKQKNAEQKTFHTVHHKTLVHLPEAFVVRFRSHVKLRKLQAYQLTHRQIPYLIEKKKEPSPPAGFIVGNCSQSLLKRCDRHLHSLFQKTAPSLTHTITDFGTVQYIEVRGKE